MKRILILSSFLAIFMMTIVGQKQSIVKNIFIEYTDNKIEKYQELIKFNDSQAEQIKQIELKYLIKIEKAENCIFCRTKKRIARLKNEKYKKIEKILSRSEFLQYKALDNEEIKQHPLWAR